MSAPEKARHVRFEDLAPERPGDRFRFLRPSMRGANVEMLRIACDMGIFVRLRLSFAERPMYGRVKLFDEKVGRVFLEVDSRKDGHSVENFLLKHIKQFSFPIGLFEEWQRLQGR